MRPFLVATAYFAGAHISHGHDGDRVYILGAPALCRSSMKRWGPANTVGVSTRWMKLPRAIMEKSAEESRRLLVPSLPLRRQCPAWPCLRREHGSGRSGAPLVRRRPRYPAKRMAERA